MPDEKIIRAVASFSKKDIPNKGIGPDTSD
jgi:hypothetical protein